MQVLSLLLIALTASANPACPDKRLDDPGQAFHVLPTYDQNKGSLRGQDLCYTIVDALLIDAHRFQQGDPLSTLTSPLSLALNHKANVDNVSNEDNQAFSGPDDGDYLGPGNPMLALLTNNNRRVCDQKYLENFVSMTAGSEPKFKKSDASTFLKSTMDQIDQMARLDGALAEKSAPLNDFYECRVSAGLTNVRDLVAAARAALAETAPIPKVQKFVERLCRDHSIELKIPRPRYEYSPYNVETISQLVGSSTPVAINFCGEVLNGKSCTEADHTSVVIGQRWNGKSCEFLIRDSVKVTGETWLPESVVRASVSGMYWIPPN